MWARVTTAGPGPEKLWCGQEGYKSGLGIVSSRKVNPMAYIGKRKGLLIEGDMSKDDVLFVGRARQRYPR